MSSTGASHQIPHSGQPPAARGPSHPRQLNHLRYQCAECQRKFSRLDHLSRHIRTHTLDRPHICTACQKSFSRADLLKRHSSRHLPEHLREELSRKDSDVSVRVSQACTACATSKLKCSEEKPCRRCMGRDIVCIYGEQQQQQQQQQQQAMEEEEQEEEEEEEEEGEEEQMHWQQPTPISSAENAKNRRIIRSEDSTQKFNLVEQQHVMSMSRETEFLEARQQQLNHDCEVDQAQQQQPTIAFLEARHQPTNPNRELDQTQQQQHQQQQQQQHQQYQQHQQPQQQLNDTFMYLDDHGRPPGMQGLSKGPAEYGNVRFETGHHSMSDFGAARTVLSLGNAGQHGTDALPNARNAVSSSETTLQAADDLNPYSGFLKDLLAHPNQNYARGMSLQQQNSETYGMWDLYMNTTYDWNLESSNVQISPVDDSQIWDALGMTAPTMSPEQVAVSAGVQAFKTFWNYSPSVADTGSVELSRLCLPPNVADQVQRGLAKNLEGLDKSLSSTDRDRVLTLVMAYCARENAPQILASFPSKRLMKSLINVSLHYFASQPWHSIHLPTLELSTISTELLATIIAYGACLIPIPAIQRLGHAIPELVRKSILDQWDRDNSKTRDIESLQTFTMVNILFVWSGNKRKMEFGESFTQPIVTILRRSGVIRRDHYATIRPQNTDSIPEVELKWQVWVKQEIKKRLVHDIFVHDSQVSIMNFTTPLISCAEMVLPLPEPDELWFASSASEWASLVFRQQLATTATLDSVCNQVRDAITHNNSPPAPSDPAVNMLRLHGLWHFVWEYRQYHDMFCNPGLPDDDEDSLSLAPRRNKMIKVLRDLQCPESSLDARSIEVELVRSFLCMNLYMPSQAIQSFVGKCGESAAMQAYSLLQQWTGTREARIGVWYAARALRAAEQLLPAMMQDFNAIVVYQASTALYAHGLVSRARRYRDALTAPQMSSRLDLSQKNLVWLGDGSLSDAQDFINFGDGVPVIGQRQDNPSGSTACSILDATSVMSYATEILKRQSKNMDGLLPPFVDNLTQLMSEIGHAALSAGF